MNYTKELHCGCTIVIINWAGRVDMCPKHKAAPDLHEALKTVLSQPVSLKQEVYDIANKALAKAEGK